MVKNKMLLIKWFIIDWMIVLPVILTILLGVILLLRILRRITRWGPVLTSHVRENALQIKGYPFREYVPCVAMESDAQSIPSNPIQKYPSVLLFLPLHTQSVKHNNIATGIALLGFRVLVISPAQLKTWASQGLVETVLKQVDQDFHPDKIVLSDYAAAFIPKLAFIFNHALGLILIRPILNPIRIRSLLQLIPLSPRWIYRLLYGRIRSTLFSHEAGVSKSSTLPANWKVAIISPQSGITDKLGEEDFKAWKENDPQGQIVDFRINQGGWDFYRQETVFFGILARFLMETDTR